MFRTRSDINWAVQLFWIKEIFRISLSRYEHDQSLFHVRKYYDFLYTGQLMRDRINYLELQFAQKANEADSCIFGYVVAARLKYAFDSYRLLLRSRSCRGYQYDTPWSNVPSESHYSRGARCMSWPRCPRRWSVRRLDPQHRRQRGRFESLH